MSMRLRRVACRPDAVHGPLELVLLAVKAQHTLAALQPLVPLLAHDGMVVSLQNGLNEQVIAQLVGAERTVGCLVNFSADYLEPGLIHYGGPGIITLGELDGSLTPRLAQLQTLLSAWGDIAITQNIWGICGVNWAMPACCLQPHWLMLAWRR
jgi:2-dehydropantoate 2-reductase